MNQQTFVVAPVDEHQEINLTWQAANFVILPDWSFVAHNVTFVCGGVRVPWVGDFVAWAVIIGQTPFFLRCNFCTEDVVDCAILKLLSGFVCRFCTGSQPCPRAVAYRTRIACQSAKESTLDNEMAERANNNRIPKALPRRRSNLVHRSLKHPRLQKTTT